MAPSPDRPTGKLALIVDQSSEEVEQLVRCLKEYDIDSQVTPTAAEALAVQSKTSIHIVFSEMNPVDQDGPLFFKELREKNGARYLPIIVATQEQELENRINTMSLEIDDYITKPYYPEEAAARIDAVLQELSDMEEWSIRSDHAFSGRLDEMSLIDLIHTMAVGEKTGEIHLTTDGEAGRVMISAGQVWHACLNKLESETALLRLLLWRQGIFHVHLQPLDPTERSLQYTLRDLSQLAAQLAEACRQLAPRLASLKTSVVVTEQALTCPDLSEVEAGWIRHLHQPLTVESLLDRPESAVQALQTIHSLLERELLQIGAESTSSDDFDTDLAQQVDRARNRSKDRYSRLASFFRRTEKKKQTSNLSLPLTSYYP
jgi:DNA-binding response OmpR family regulator